MKIKIEGNFNEYMGNPGELVPPTLVDILISKLKADVEIEIESKFAKWKHERFISHKK